MAIANLATGDQNASPSIGADGTIYIGTVGCSTSSGTCYVYAINPDGTVKWKFKTDGYYGRVFTAPAVGPDGTVYAVGLDPATLYAINPTGTLKWNRQLL